MDIISMQQYGQIFMEMRNYLKKRKYRNKKE